MATGSRFLARAGPQNHKFNQGDYNAIFNMELMQNYILEKIREIEPQKKSIPSEFEKIKALLDSKIKANEILAVELVKAKGYTPLQTKCILGLLSAEMELDNRIAIDILDGTEISLDTIASGVFTKKMLEDNSTHPVARLIHGLKDRYIVYPQNTNLEISLQEKEAYFYLVFIADQLPFCVLGESADVENFYHKNYGIKHLLTVNLLSEIPSDMKSLVPIQLSLDIKLEITDHLFDWVNFKGDGNSAQLEMMIESMNDDQWGLGIGFYNEDNKYISVLDMEIDEGEMNINQDDLEHIKENYPHFLAAPNYKKENNLSSDEIQHIWTYNLLKNYL